MRLLDLFCGEGGAARGYARAGFDVTGVDIERRSRYPFDFVQGDALAYVAEHGREFDVIHASPPCQRYSIATSAIDRSRHPDLVAPTRDALKAVGRPYVIENVPGAPLHGAFVLCGTMFNLTATDVDGTPLALRRHRLFESNEFIFLPAPCRHDPNVQVGGVYGGGSATIERARTVRHGGYTPPTAVRAELLGIEGMTQYGLSQAIPPAYTQWIGEQLAERLA